MKFLIKYFVFCTQIYSITAPGRNYVLQTVTIDNERDLADIHVRNGLCSSDTIFDYKHVSKLKYLLQHRGVSRMICFNPVKHLNISAPASSAVASWMMTKMYSPKYWWVEYEPADSIIAELKEWLQYGDAIEALCKGVPLYEVHKVESGINSGGCAKAGIPDILHISICGTVHL
uniref:Gastrokine 2 n=1 Tax=Crocodylus porosus TaxID=8502 RepID=A0A7M4FFK9_CROPO